MNDRNRLFAFFALLLGLGYFWSSSASAQLLQEEGVPMVQRVKRKTTEQFKTKMTLAEHAKAAGGELPKFFDPKTALPAPTYLFSASGRDLPEGAGTFDGLPRCAENRIRRKQIFPGETALKNLEVIAYQFGDAEQEKLAAGNDKAVPYIEGDLVNPYRNFESRDQDFIRILGFECLPSSVSHTTVGGDSFLEYKEGSLAWK